MMSEKKKIFILVKTYPTISKEYAELVCTAGILEDGSWIRLYPVPFRKLDIEQKYPKYAWIEVDVNRNTKDFRPETYRPNLTSLIVGEIPKKLNWNERNKIIFKNQKIYIVRPDFWMSSFSGGAFSPSIRTLCMATVSGMADRFLVTGIRSIHGR